MELYILSFFLIFLNLFNCSTVLHKKSDYNRTREYLLNNNPGEAVLNLPSLEKSSFITVVEKTYINLLSGKAEIKELISYQRKIESRIRYGVKREFNNFFYLETPEGYYASEHEIIWVHYLLSWGYSLQGEYDKALIEVKKGNNLLSGEITQEGKFEDPLMRIFQGVLYAMAGSWEDSRIDFKYAYNLDKSLVWALELSKLEDEPSNLIVILNGGGTEPFWDPSLEFNPVRGIRTLNFIGKGQYSKLVLLSDKNEKIPLYLTPKSDNWYKRHFTRDTELHDIIKDSKYSQEVLGSIVKGTVVSTGGVVLGSVIVVGSVGVGGGVIYLGFKSGSSDLATMGVVVGAAIIVKGFETGYEIILGSFDYSKKDLETNLDTSESYRFVRFLPEYLNIGWNMNNNFSSYSLQNRKEEYQFENNKLGKNKNITIKYYSDSK